MHLDRPVRKQNPISLTPLVDVIFLLLLFFMLSSTFTSFAQVKIGNPAGSGGRGAVPQAMLVLDQARLMLNGREIAQTDLYAKAQALQTREIDRLLVLVRGETTTQQLMTVMDQLSNIHGLTIIVAGPE
ncbi:biopolymer transporter ExbD [Roseibium porphyridii]|uniref:Biopolymer transporter ExbD n=1 Tax=Roseibium porphyridii TaxID=2866279 RepID=A0ABY8F6L6_9HYPH|nr:biopolymer transporter ExbD [Roseibium sp. KMA01]QFT30360.1 biopolymer transport protein ExbD [Labrenzia sp. THAF82]WFE91006.1 biopolymer transporter ExbD [Roseibium sp. KMA01]